MKILQNILTSASSGAYTWSNIIDTRSADNGFFNLEWDITTGSTVGSAGYGVTFAWAGCSTSTGTFTRSTTLIKEGGTSTSGPASDGKDFIGFGPEIFPFIKVGAKATGTTTALTAHLIMH